MPALLKTTQIQEPSSATVNLTLDTLGNASFAGMPYGASSFLRNRLINGDMRIDQRNAGASTSVGTATATYTLDRWRVYHDTAITSNITAQQSSTVPSQGFSYSQILTNGTSASPAAGDFNVIQQRIEGFNTADLSFGSSSAVTTTLSFWVRSSLTGTFGVGLTNSAQDRSVVYTYTISAANTWEQKSITITGDQSGTWLTTNGIGIVISWDLGSGTNSNAAATGTWYGARYVRTSACTNFIGTTGATFYITGVQLEVGSVATPFERRQYGQELALCQRYYETNFPSGTAPGATDATNPTYLYMDGLAVQTHTGQQYVAFKATKRSNPTITIYSPNNGASGVVYDFNGLTNRTAASQYAGPWSFVGYSTSLGSANNVNMAFNWTAASEL